MVDGAAPLAARWDGEASAMFWEAVHSVTRGDPTEETLHLVCRQVCELAGFDFCAVILPDAQWKQIHLAGQYGLAPGYAERLRSLFLIPFGEQGHGSPTRRAAERGRTYVLRDAVNDESFAPWRSLAQEFGYRTIVAVPLRVDGQVIGVLNGYSAEVRDFTSSQLSAVEGLAAHAAISLHVATLIDTREETIHRLRRSNDELHRQQKVLERAHEIHRRLTELVLQGTDFESVAQTLSAVIHRPVAITDVHGVTLCPSAGETEGAALERAIASIGDPRDTDAEQNSIVGPIRIGTELLGYVVVADAGPVDADLDVRAVEHATTVLALQIAMQRVAQATEARMQADFLSDLFRGNLANDPGSASRLRRHNLSLDRQHRVVIMISDDSPGKGHQHLDAARHEGRPEVLAIVQGELAKIPNTLISAVGDTITAVVEFDPSIAESAETLRNVLKAIQERAAGSAGVHFAIGVGSPASAISDFAASHREANLCADLSRRLSRHHSVLMRDELGILGLLVDNRNPTALLAVARQTLGPLIDREAKGDGILIETLTTYLDNSCDIQACADTLYVHPNTVKYRLRRVEEMCNLKLKDPNDLFAIRLATLTLQLL